MLPAAAGCPIQTPERVIAPGEQSSDTLALMDIWRALGREASLPPWWSGAVFAGSMVLLIAAGVSRVAGGLNPPQLYLDDQWVAVLVDHASILDLFALRPPVPLGFVVLLKVVTSCLGHGSLQLQIMPFVLGLALLPLTGWIAWNATGRLSLGIAAAGLMGGRALLVSSIRVKQYTLEGFAALLLIVIATECVRRNQLDLNGDQRQGQPLHGKMQLHQPGAWVLLIAIAVLALPFSFSAAPIGLVAVNAVALHLLLVFRAHRARPPVRVLVGALGYNVLLLLWLAFATEQSNEAMHGFWRNHYMPFQDIEEFWAFVQLYGTRFFTDALPWMLGWLAVGVPLAIVLLCLRRPTRLIGLALLAFYGGIFAASALHLYPIGGWRTDAFSYPITVLAVVAAIWCLSRWLAFLPQIAAAGILAYYMLLFPGPRIDYPPQFGREALEFANEVIHETDALLVTPQSSWAVACYGRWPVELVRAHDVSNGFIALPERDHALVLRESEVGRGAGEGAAATLESQLERLLEHQPQHVFLLSVHFWSRSDAWVISYLTPRGYTERPLPINDRSLRLFERTVGTETSDGAAP